MNDQKRDQLKMGWKSKTIPWKKIGKIPTRAGTMKIFPLLPLLLFLLFFFCCWPEGQRPLGQRGQWRGGKGKGNYSIITPENKSSQQLVVVEVYTFVRCCMCDYTSVWVCECVRVRSSPVWSSDLGQWVHSENWLPMSCTSQPPPPFLFFSSLPVLLLSEGRI